MRGLRQIVLIGRRRQQSFLRVPWRPFFASESPMKKHHERRLIRYPMEELYEVVADVSKYHEFVPWCKNSKVLEQSDKAMRAELTVGFQLLNERYISNVVLQKPTCVIATSTQTNLFEYLKSEWKFSPSSDPNATWVTFNVQFKFRLALYNEISELFMEEVVKNMVKAFESRCRVIHQHRLKQQSQAANSVASGRA